MKKIFLFLLTVILASSMSAQNQHGYVKTPGHLLSNAKVSPGKRVQGATINVSGRNAVISANQGAFSIPIQNGKFTLTSVTKSGYCLVDRDALKQYSYSSNPLVIVMEEQSVYEDYKFENEQKIRKNLEKQLRQKRDEIERLNEENRITKEEYRKEIQRLNESQDNSQKLISEMSERFSSTDFDELDEFNIRINECILNGQLVKADSLLRSKGNLDNRINEYLQQRQAIDEQQFKLNKAKEYARTASTNACTRLL